MSRKRIKDLKDNNKGINTKMVKRTFEIERLIFDRLKQAKKERGITMNWFVNTAITNELNSVDRYEKMENIIKQIKEEIPDIIRNSVDTSELGPMLSELSNEIKPTLDIARSQSIEIKLKQAIDFESMKTNILHRLMNGYEIPTGLIYLKVLETLEDDGYIYQTTPGTFQISQRDILRDVDYLI